MASCRHPNVQESRRAGEQEEQESRRAGSGAEEQRVCDRAARKTERRDISRVDSKRGEGRG
eukprot:300840-Hanusia_phi.AAC.2